MANELSCANSDIARIFVVYLVIPHHRNEAPAPPVIEEPPEKPPVSHFGCHLLHVTSVQDGVWALPALIDETIDHIREKGLQTEGVFRISASSGALEKAKEEVDNRVPLTFDSSETVEVCCGLLKVWPL